MSVDVSRLDEVEESGEVRRVGGRTHAWSSSTEKKISLLFIPLQGPRCLIVTIQDRYTDESLGLKNFTRLLYWKEQKAAVNR